MCHKTSRWINMKNQRMERKRPWLFPHFLQHYREGNLLVAGKVPSQRFSKVESVSMSWRHMLYYTWRHHWNGCLLRIIPCVGTAIPGELCGHWSDEVVNKPAGNDLIGQTHKKRDWDHGKAEAWKIDARLQNLGFIRFPHWHHIVYWVMTNTQYTWIIILVTNVFKMFIRISVVEKIFVSKNWLICVITDCYNTFCTLRKFLCIFKHSCGNSILWNLHLFRWFQHIH